MTYTEPQRRGTAWFSLIHGHKAKVVAVIESSRLGADCKARHFLNGTAHYWPPQPPLRAA